MLWSILGDELAVFNRTVIIVSPSSSATKQHLCLDPQRSTQLGPRWAAQAWEGFDIVASPARVTPNASRRLAMAASPNSATRSRSSSAATPDAIFDEPIDNIGCSHISALLADPTESNPLLKRFRRVVTWKAQRTHEALHSPKRRKVCHSSPLGYFCSA